MLLEFSVTNFRSIKEKQTLSLLKTKKNELENNFTTITLSTGKTLDVLNSAVIYGANASGKSNLVLAIKSMLRIIYKSFAYEQNQGTKNIEPFLLSENSLNQATEFELNFVDNGVQFVYGFSATQKKIINEWLYQYPKGRPQVLIARENTNTWSAMSALQGNKKLWQDSTKDNALFLSTAIQLNSKQLTKISFINNIKPVLNSFGKGFTCNIAKKNKNTITNFIKKADFGIKNFSIIEEEADKMDLPVEIRERLQSKVEDLSKLTSFKIKTQRLSNNGNIIEFDLNIQESSGTQKIFAIAGPWLDVLENGYCLVLDELQNSLHPKLVEYLVKMFHNPEINKNGAQLIFVTHETSLLDQEIFRRDQVWFCAKENNATELFSLVDFKVRKGVDNLEKSYLSGRYGAVPYLI